MSRRGFTAIEVLLAAAVSTVVLAGAFGLMTWMDRAVSRLNDRAQSEAEMNLLHQTVRRAMQTLVVAETAPPEEREAEGDGEGDSSTRAAENGEDGEEAEEVDAQGEPVRMTRPRFLLEPQIPGRGGEWDPRRLEMVLLEQPAPGAPRWAGTIRGAFELRPTQWGTQLIWQSLEPAGDAVVLAEDVAAIQWTALTKEAVAGRFSKESLAWKSDLAATTRAEAPKALRLVLRMDSGAQIDWLFELAVTSGPAP